MNLARYAKLARSLIDWREVRIRLNRCPLCHFPYAIKLSNHEHAVRCLGCGGNPAALSLGEVLLHSVPDISEKHIYELSSRGPLFRFLRKRAGKLTFSEFYDDVSPGTVHCGVLCQDVQKLTFPDKAFDVCTSTDVFEHVPDDIAGFREIHRVLSPGGCTIFTVPYAVKEETVERARIVDGRVDHVLPPEYHADHIHGLHKVLCYRNYGADILDRLNAAGFSRAEVIGPNKTLWWGYGRHVIVAFR